MKIGMNMLLWTTHVTEADFPHLEKIKEAGGKIVIEKKEVPGVGQFSLFEDPDGRVLGMWKKIKKG